MASELSKFIEDELAEKGVTADDSERLLGALRVEARQKEQLKKQKFKSVCRNLTIVCGILTILIIWLVLGFSNSQQGQTPDTSVVHPGQNQNNKQPADNDGQGGNGSPPPNSPSPSPSPDNDQPEGDQGQPKDQGETDKKQKTTAGDGDQPGKGDEKDPQNASSGR